MPYGVDEPGYKCGMPRELRLRGLVRPGRSDRKDDRRGLSDTLPACFAGRRGDGHRETDLAAAGQLDIDLLQPLRVDQRALLAAHAAVSSVSCAACTHPVARESAWS